MSGRTIIIERSASPETPAACGACDWRGSAGDLAPVTDAVLTPGDPAPAGRCPECDSLAYLARPVARVREHALQFAKVAAEIIWGSGTDDGLQRAIDKSRTALSAADIRNPDAIALGIFPDEPS